MSTGNTLKPATPQITLVIWGAIIMAAITITAIVTVVKIAPTNTSVLAIITGISSPIILMLIGIGLQGVHTLVNSNLMEQKTKVEMLEAKIDGLNAAAVASANLSIERLESHPKEK